MDKTNLIIRRETPADFLPVETLTREAFWNRYVPGCDEHYLTHLLREDPAFIPELDFVAELDGRVVGSILYTRAQIRLDAGGSLPVLSFGPLCVLPAFQGLGIGGRLIRHTQALAAQAGEAAILIYGDPGYYRRHGFLPAETYGIGSQDGCFRDALQALTLREGALDRAAGLFAEAKVYELDAAAGEAFDTQFPPMEKVSGTESQRRFAQMLTRCRPRE